MAVSTRGVRSVPLPSVVVVVRRPGRWLAKETLTPPMPLAPGVPAGGAGTPQVVGTFTVTTSGLHSYPVQLTRSLQDYSVLAISEEAAGSTPAKPSGGVLARGALSR